MWKLSVKALLKQPEPSLSYLILDKQILTQSLDDTIIGCDLDIQYNSQLMSQFDAQNLQLALPRVTSLLFAGAALYIGFVDPCVRDTHKDQREQLTHWSAMYNHSKIPMAALAGLSTLFGANAFRITHQPLWIYGSLAAFAIIPFTMFGIMGTNKKLAEDLSSSRPGSSSQSVADRLTSWVWKHRVRALLAIASAVLFYAAEGRPTSTTKIVHQVPVVKVVTLKK